jgi:hypothetical protein
MARLVFGMNQSLDGYVDHTAFSDRGRRADLAHSLTLLGLIDEYRIYLHPVVLGRGTPYFAGPRPPLRLLASDRMSDDVIRLTYVPA